MALLPSLLWWRETPTVVFEEPDPLLNTHFAILVPNCYSHLAVSALGVALKTFGFAGFDTFQYHNTDSSELLGITLHREPTTQDMVRIAHGLVFVITAIHQMGNATGHDTYAMPPIQFEPNSDMIDDERCKFFYGTMTAMSNDKIRDRFVQSCGLSPDHEEGFEGNDL